MLFMGEEYAELAPFLYFVSHSDPVLSEAVRKGRREEFVDFIWPATWPDPCCENTFARSKLDHTLRTRGHHAAMWKFHQELIRLRKTVPALRALSKQNMTVRVAAKDQAVVIQRLEATCKACLVLNFNREDSTAEVELPAGNWKKVLDSSDVRWGGPGHPAGRHAVLWLES
jgi:maltooligosyltrehalose trehalohydrolase